jgi:dienelactone hydrolase
MFRFDILKTLFAWLAIGLTAHAEPPAWLTPPGEPLEESGDLADRLVSAVDQFLDRQLAAAPERTAAWWDPQADAARRDRLWHDNRERLARILGLRDPRPHPVAVQLDATFDRSAVVAESDDYVVSRVRWPALEGVLAEGLLLEPRERRVCGGVVAIPDADQLPEHLAGLLPTTDGQPAVAAELARRGVRVLIPTLVSRARQQRGNAWLANREFLYRSAFVLGRHLIGYEVQETLAGIDWLAATARREDPSGDVRLGVVGWGEGGLLAYAAAALDPRIDVACVSGYVDDRRAGWEQPIERNVFGLLERFGDAELALLVHPRQLIIEASRGPEEVRDGRGGAPATLRSPELAAVRQEYARAAELCRRWLGDADHLQLTVSEPAGQGPPWTAGTQAALLAALGLEAATPASTPSQPVAFDPSGAELAAARQDRIIAQLDRFNQDVLEQCADERAALWGAIDTSSEAAYLQSIEPFRGQFRTAVIGDFAPQLAELRPRWRLAYDEPEWIGYEVALDAFDEVFVTGILCVPRNLAQGERRPVVVCQHGLEGRARDIVAGDHPAYHDFAARLAARGYVTFAPQHVYLFEDRFRTLQRKANPLGKTLFSVMVPQHRQIVRWLQSLPFVDADRMAFYGLSYGGKSAMRIPPLIPEYKAVICSADFNDWVWKNASTRSPYSYVWTGEYEIFEFDLGTTFNYAEMAALIAPRPFMVERGHADGVAPDERVAYEFAKVRRLYQAGLKRGDRCTIEFFDGPHTIHGVGTFEFLDRHLDRP